MRDYLSSSFVGHDDRCDFGTFVRAIEIDRSSVCLFFSSEIRKVSSVSAIGSRLATVGKVRGGGERVKGKKKQVQGDGGARPEVITGMRLR